LYAYGADLTDVPGVWPPTTGASVHDEVRWVDTENGVPLSPEVWSNEDGSGFTVGWGGYAEYCVSKHDSVTTVDVQRGSISLEEAGMAFVLSVLPLALPLFDLEPLHGSAVAIPDRGAMLILGDSESGKSTTAFELTKRGLRFVSDDACALDREAALWPGPPLLASRSQTDDHPVLAHYDRKTVIAFDDHDTSPLPVVGAVVLEPGPSFDLEVEEVPMRSRVSLLLRYVRAPWFMGGLREPLQFAAVAGAAVKPLGTVRFDKNRHAPSAVAAAVLEAMA